MPENSEEILIQPALNLGVFLTALYFLLTTLLKLISPANFKGFLARLSLVPERFENLLVLTLMGGSLAISLLLLFRVCLPLSLGIALLWTLMGMSTTAWAEKKRGTKSCGCYGPFEGVSIKFSQTVHGFLTLILILAFAVTLQEPFAWNPSPVFLMASPFLITGAVVLGYFRLATNPKGATSEALLQTWAAWGWIFPSPPAQGLIIYFSSNCSDCEAWTRLLNVLHAHGGKFKVWGVEYAPDSGSSQKLSIHRFPVRTAGEEELRGHVREFPTVFKIDGNEIVSRWVGSIPEELKNYFYNLPPRRSHP